ncbi:unnamed protein product [Adineta ricciae]|uniref:G-protein coupled receptors family 1 profile domain-containing protein n=1 Tax=Adineta ricciae TaxID=249248 RepID=A0A814W349_ADIRI|nr:unnamed protein product [Adineta ricciae]CAF1314145.1 unnamed protein product [Adineta ricciae]
MPISFYYLERIWPATNTYCVWWNWYEYSSNTAGVILMAWASIERYFFIFYPRFLLGEWWKKWCFHFIPIYLCILWPSSWYFAVSVISPGCVNVWQFDQVICGVPCFTMIYGGILGVLHLLLNIMIPIFVIVATNIALISRVICEKFARRQIVNWPRQRRMAFQLWFVSSLYMTGWLPLTFTGLVQFTGRPTFMMEHLSNIYFALYFVPLLLPIVCLCLFPDVVKITRELLKRRRINRVATMT